MEENEFLEELYSIPMGSHTYALAFDSEMNDFRQFAACSFENTKNNYCDFFYLKESVFEKHPTSIQTCFPFTCCQFNQHNSDEDCLFLAGSDLLRVYSLQEDNFQLGLDLPLNKSNHPISAVDWNSTDNQIVLAASLDCTVSGVDIYQSEVAFRVIAHDHPIHDVKFVDHENTFITAGYDGSLRLFDIRDLSSLTLIYQSSIPLLRVEISPFDSNKIALITRNATGVTLVDVRNPGSPDAFTSHDNAIVTGIKWSAVDPGVMFSSNTHGELRYNIFNNDKTKSPNTILFDCGKQIESIEICTNMIALTTSDHIHVLKSQIMQK